MRPFPHLKAGNVKVQTTLLKLMLVVNFVIQTPYIGTAKSHQRTSRHMLIHSVRHKILMEYRILRGGCENELYLREHNATHSNKTASFTTCRRLPRAIHSVDTTELRVTDKGAIHSVDTTKLRVTDKSETHVIILSLEVKLCSRCTVVK
jgi:hypothetical protein